MSPPRLPEDLFSIYDDLARRVHADPDSAVLDVQNGNGDVVSDHQGFGNPAGQNQHVPLPPCATCIHCASINIIMFKHYCVQESNLAVCARWRPCKADKIVVAD